MTFGQKVRLIISRTLLPLKEILFLSGVWLPPASHALDEPVAQFISMNEQYWPRCGASSGQRVLVEGHLSQYGPNYILRTAVAAKAIQERRNCDIEIVCNGYSHQWTLAKKIYDSFGIHNFLHLGSCFFFSNILFFCVSRCFAVFYTFRLRSPADILVLRFGPIKVGDLIYDDVIRESKQKTIEAIDGHVTLAVAKSFYFYLQYKRLFRRQRYSYYISTHTAYSEYGLLCRVALMNGVKVIETTDIQMAVYDHISDEQLPTYHDGIKRSVCSDLNDPHVELESLRQEAKQSLAQRLDSKIKQIDAQKAYIGKVYDKAELSQKLAIEQGHKIVFILAHIFADAPHLSSAMLHVDYYRWLTSTLNVCARSSGVRWVIKPHPSSEIYGESGLVEKLVIDVQSSNLSICPADLNTKSISTCADAIVTVHGTAGLEFACLGVPVVLAGRPFYSGFGFTTEPESVTDYERELLALKDISPLSESQVKKALEVYSIWDRQFDWNNPIITPDVLANVWGSGMARDLGRAFSLMTQNLRTTDPRRLKLWAFAQMVAN